MDSPERQLSYMSDQEDLDAISFIPTKDITFVGFTIYAVWNEKTPFTCHWKCKVGDRSLPSE